MFRNLDEFYSRKRGQTASMQYEANGHEQSQMPPAQTEELPPGLIGDEI